MSEENVLPKNQRRHVVLSDLSQQKLDKWFEQINAKKKIRISRKQLVNWLIERQPDNLSNGELNALIDTFYDEEKFLKQLLNDVRKAKSIGNSDSLEVIVRPRRQEIKKDLGDPI